VKPCCSKTDAKCSSSSLLAAEPLDIKVNNAQILRPAIRVENFAERDFIATSPWFFFRQIWL